jgi:putative transcriptional regulator
MTQSVFASYMGVSIKTVEAWEGGRTHPTGPVFRLLDILSKNEEMEYIVAK